MDKNAYKCRCGKNMDEVLKPVKWSQNDIDFTINNVPEIICTRSGCNEEYRTAFVQINVSIIADKMRSGEIIPTAEYIEHF